MDELMAQALIHEPLASYNPIPGGIPLTFSSLTDVNMDIRMLSSTRLPQRQLSNFTYSPCNLAELLSLLPKPEQQRDCTGNGPLHAVL
jgi:hypothetical protein